MRTLATVIAIILLASLILNGYLIWDKRQAQKQLFENNDRLNEVITSKQAEILKSDSLVKAIQDKRAATRVKDSIEIRGLKTRISALKGKVVEIPEITPPDSAVYVQSRLKDNVIAAQDSLISTLELTHAAEVVDLEAIIHEQSRQIMAQAAISDAWRQTAEQTQQDVAKERRRKGFWKVTSGILTAGIIFMAVRD